jgi:hypothetical protein
LDRAYLQKLLYLKLRRCPLIETVTVTGLEETDEGIAVVLEHARSLDAPLQITADGRILTFSDAASYLQIRSRKALPLEEDTYESDVDSSSDYWHEEDENAGDEEDGNGNGNNVDGEEESWEDNNDGG